MAKSNHYHHYQGASYKVLLALFKELYPQTAHCRFVDIGCGKGRAVLVAEYMGYRRLTGIDLDEELVEEARANAARYRFKQNDSEIRFICQNALTYDYPNEATVYFLFNPFPEHVLSEVLKRILSQNQQELWFVYMNPLFPRPFFEQNLRLVKTHKTTRYTEALIFRSQEMLH